MNPEIKEITETVESYIDNVFRTTDTDAVEESENTYLCLSKECRLLRIMSCPELLRAEAENQANPLGFLKQLRQWRDDGYPDLKEWLRTYHLHHS